MCMRLYVALCILIGTCVRCPIKSATLYRSPLKSLPFSQLRLMRLFWPLGVGISSTCIWPSALLSNVNVSTTTRDDGGKHVERLSERAVLLPMFLFLGSDLRHTVSKATTFDHGGGGGVGIYEILMRKITQGRILAVRSMQARYGGKNGKNDKLQTAM